MLVVCCLFSRNPNFEDKRVVWLISIGRLWLSRVVLHSHNQGQVAGKEALAGLLNFLTSPSPPASGSREGCRDDHPQQWVAHPVRLTLLTQDKCLACSECQ
jgi:hypothetical protein